MTQQLITKRATEACFTSVSGGEAEQMFVIYDDATSPPDISIKQISTGVYGVSADGLTIAVIARHGKGEFTKDDVILQPRQ